MTHALLTATLIASASVVSADPPPAPAPSAPAAGAARRLAAFCERDSSAVDKALGEPGMCADFRAFIGGAGVALESYGACRSLQGASDACSVLGGLGPGHVSACRETEARRRLLRQILRSSDGVGACKENLATTRGKRGPDMDRLCATLVAGARAGDALPVCPEAKQAGLFGPEAPCEEALIFWKGDPASCAAIKHLERRRICQEDALLVAGLRDPARCSASPDCLAFESKKAVCAKYRDEFFRVVCAGVSDETKRLAHADDILRQAELRKQQEARAAYDAKLKAEAMAQARLKAEAEAARGAKRQYKKHEPMVGSSEAVQENMRRMSQGLAPMTDAEMSAFGRRKTKSPTPPPGQPQPPNP